MTMIHCEKLEMDARSRSSRSIRLSGLLVPFAALVSAWLLLACSPAASQTSGDGGADGSGWDDGTVLGDASWSDGRMQDSGDRDGSQQDGGAGQDGSVGDDAALDAGPCIPDCSGAQCGSDGCGGSCGVCEGERVCSSSRKCIAVTYPASGHEIGVDYHAVGPDFLNDCFLTRYQDQGVRTQVQSQLAGMAAAGATVISTRIWMVQEPGGTSPETWRHHFPLSTQEVAGIRAYAEDVAAAGMKLYLVFLYLGCADYHLGSPDTTLGWCDLSADEFVARTQQSIAAVLQAVSDVYLPNGLPVVERVFLDGEVMTASNDQDPATQWEKANQRWFLRDTGIVPWFWEQVRLAGMIPTMYFLPGGDEASVLDVGYNDSTYAALNGHRSMYWVYRTIRFLADNNLPIPDRIDFSCYPHPDKTNHATIYNRMLDDFQATIPALLGKQEQDFFFAETLYHSDAALRMRVHKGLASQFAIRPNFKGVTFWTTPNAGGDGDHSGYPFDFSGLDDSDIIRPTFPNPTLEQTGAQTCGTMDNAVNPASWCTEWANGNVTDWSISQSGDAAFQGIYGLKLFFGSCATSPCQDSQYPGVFVLSDQAQGVAADRWAVVHVLGSYDADDQAGGMVLIDSGSANADAVNMVRSAHPIDYVMVGRTSSTDLTLRFQILTATPQGAVARFDWVR